MMEGRTNTSDRREHEHRQSSDRRTGNLPRLIDRDAAVDAAAQALAVGMAIEHERAMMAAEYAASQGH